jgi:curved DNA-binding protein CbpA
MPSAPNLKSNDYYQILGCPRNADDAELKKAYRKLAVKVRLSTRTNDNMTTGEVVFDRFR